MSTVRADTTKRFPTHRADGSKQCRECGADVPAGRRNWCGRKCVEAYEIRAMPSRMRRYVHQRDHGVCAICRIDTRRVARWLSELPHVTGAGHWRYGREDRYTKQSNFGRVLGRHRARAVVLLGRLWGVRVDHRKTLWDADHIVPVAEGGGACGLENLRTLCLRCHKEQTTALAGRLARRPSKGVGR